MEKKRSVVSFISVVFLAALLAFTVLNPTQAGAETFTIKAVTAWPGNQDREESNDISKHNFHMRHREERHMVNKRKRNPQIDGDDQCRPTGAESKNDKH